MSARPANMERIMSVSNTVVWAFRTYGGIPYNAVTDRPGCTKRENIQSVNETINWLVT